MHYYVKPLDTISVMPALERMLDANLNRACEGLRTLEDLARFILDDGELAEQAKVARHAVREVALSLGPRRLVAWRDTPNDVGTTISTVQERERADAGAIAAAAGNRTAEALRACEESAKVLGLDAQLFERTRYDAYEIQRRLVLALGVADSAMWPLCALITASACRRPWQEVAEAACRGGVACLQLREKHLDDGELLARARRLVEIARPWGTAVVINDRLDIALLSGASGVHVGQGDLSAADVRRVVGDRLLVGVSCSTIEMARRAVRDGADYLGLGPMFPSNTKPKDSLSGPALIEAVLLDSLASTRPHLAISGIDRLNVRELIASGCRGIAVCGSVCGADDPEAATRELMDIVASAQPASDS